jgi:hypothetical protein
MAVVLESVGLSELSQFMARSEYATPSQEGTARQSRLSRGLAQKPVCDESVRIQIAPSGTGRVDRAVVALAPFRVWRRAVADSLEEAGDMLFAFTRYPATPMAINPHFEKDAGGVRMARLDGLLS